MKHGRLSDCCRLAVQSFFPETAFVLRHILARLGIGSKSYSYSDIFHDSTHSYIPCRVYSYMQMIALTDAASRLYRSQLHAQQVPRLCNSEVPLAKRSVLATVVQKRPQRLMSRTLGLAKLASVRVPLDVRLLVHPCNHGLGPGDTVDVCLLAFGAGSRRALEANVRNPHGFLGEELVPHFDLALKRFVGPVVVHIQEVELALGALFDELLDPRLRVGSVARSIISSFPQSPARE